MRPRHARQRPRPVGGRPSGARRDRRASTRAAACSPLRGEGAWIELDFPAKPQEPAEAPPGPGRSARRRAALRRAGNQFDYVVEVESETVVRALHPRLHRPARPSRCAASSSPAAPRPRLRLRLPLLRAAAGIDEDPVTGSAHCCLGPLWAARLGRRELVAFQASARGGIVRVRVGEGRVYLGGQAVTVLRGELATAAAKIPSS